MENLPRIPRRSIQTKPNGIFANTVVCQTGAGGCLSSACSIHIPIFHRCYLGFLHPPCVSARSPRPPVYLLHNLCSSLLPLSVFRCVHLTEHEKSSISPGKQRPSLSSASLSLAPRWQTDGVVVRARRRSRLHWFLCNFLLPSLKPVPSVPLWSICCRFLPLASPASLPPVSPVMFLALSRLFPRARCQKCWHLLWAICVLAVALRKQIRKLSKETVPFFFFL